MPDVFLNHSFLRQDLSLNLKLTSLARLTALSSREPPVSIVPVLGLQHCAQLLTWVLEI